jgi:hypothetical protein
MKSQPLTALLLAADDAAPGAAALLERARALLAAGGDVRVLLSGRGLAWALDPRLTPLCEAADVAVCSRHAREAGWTADRTPPHIRWSSVATWLAEIQAQPAVALWTALP